MAQGQDRYKVIEPTYEVEGGDTPLDALARDLNALARDGWRLFGETGVREPGGSWVRVLVLERANPGH